MNGQSTRFWIDRSMACFLSARGEIAVFGGDRVALLDEARDAGANPGALEQRARTRAPARPRRAIGAPADLQAEGDPGRQVGVDEDLVARLHAVDHARPDPPGAVDRDGDPGARGVGQPADELRRRVARRVRTTPSRASPAVTRRESITSSRIPPTAITSSRCDADARQGRHPRPKLVGGDLSRGRHAVGHQQHARAARLVGQRQRPSARSRSEAPSAPRATSRLPTTPIPRAGLAGKQGDHILVERGDREVGSPFLRSSASSRSTAAASSPRPSAREALVSTRSVQVAELLARRGLGQRDDARDDQVVVAEPEAAARGAGAPAAKSASGVKPRRSSRVSALPLRARGSPASPGAAARAAGAGTAHPRASAPARRR